MRDLILVNPNLVIPISNSRRRVTTHLAVREALVVLTLLNTAPLKFMANQEAKLLRDSIKEWTVQKVYHQTQYERVWSITSEKDICQQRNPNFHRNFLLL